MKRTEPVGASSEEELAREHYGRGRAEEDVVSMRRVVDVLNGELAGDG